ncbi:hypothetical protein ACHAXR_004928 [Thalassiosira sp. AJA248-18]
MVVSQFTIGCLVFIILLVPPPLFAQWLSNCKGGCPSGEICVANTVAHVSDEECSKCINTFIYPCNKETHCYCNSAEENAPKYPPMPKSGLAANEDYLDPCQDGVLTEEIFDAIVQPSTVEGRALYTYKGLCDAIVVYNTNHDETFAGMGDNYDNRVELAAFLAHAVVDTNVFSVIREESGCIDPITGSDEKVYCKPCTLEYYDYETKKCKFTSVQIDHCHPQDQEPYGCNCTRDLKPVDLPISDGIIDATQGYIAASDAYFKRGAIPLSWNAGYYGASLAIFGDPAILCDNPDLIATNSTYAWAAGIYQWMRTQRATAYDQTAHTQAMKGNFGGTVHALHKQYECPTKQYWTTEWANTVPVQMVQNRVAQICKIGTAFKVYLEMDRCPSPTDNSCLKCDGLAEVYDLCKQNGSCPDCETWWNFARSAAPSGVPSSSPSGAPSSPPSKQFTVSFIFYLTST